MNPKKETKIFIGCLPADTNEEELKEYFLQYCTDLTNFKVKFRSNGICSGYAYFSTGVQKNSWSTYYQQTTSTRVDF